MDFNWIGSTAAQNIILFLTLLMAISIGVKQNEINEGIHLANLKPTVLRSGTFEHWADLKGGNNKGDPLTFLVLNNAAFDISGFIVIEGKKYELIFSFSTLREGRIFCENSYRRRIGWINKGGYLCGVFDPKKSEDTDLDNQMVLKYRDSQAHTYTTTENKDFVQVVERKVEK